MKKLRHAVILACLLSAADSNAASTINATNAYSWGANVGWTNWRPSTADGVSIGEYICSGYVWGANVGWINLGNGLPANNIQYSNTSATDYGINFSYDPTQPGKAILRGLAYGANIGWINFEAQGNPRLRFSDGHFEGYAYSANCGWINLGDGSFFMQTDAIKLGVDNDGDGMPDAFEFQYFGGLGATAGGDSDGDGVTNRDEYLAGTDPTLATDRLQITYFDPLNPLGTSSDLTWTSTAARFYAIETTTNLLTPFVDSGLGILTPDAGPTTTRTVSATGSGLRFFRIKSIQPPLFQIAPAESDK